MDSIVDVGFVAIIVGFAFEVQVGSVEDVVPHVVFLLDVVEKTFVLLAALVQFGSIETADEAVIRLIIDPLLQLLSEGAECIDDDTFT